MGIYTKKKTAIRNLCWSTNWGKKIGYIDNLSLLLIIKLVMCFCFLRALVLFPIISSLWYIIEVSLFESPILSVKNFFSSTLSNFCIYIFSGRSQYLYCFNFFCGNARLSVNVYCKILLTSYQQLTLFSLNFWITFDFFSKIGPLVLTKSFVKYIFAKPKLPSLRSQRKVLRTFSHKALCLPYRLSFFTSFLNHFWKFIQKITYI